MIVSVVRFHQSGLRELFIAEQCYSASAQYGFIKSGYVYYLKVTDMTTMIDQGGSQQRKKFNTYGYRASAALLQY
jgi:hypothetical protein